MTKGPSNAPLLNYPMKYVSRVIHISDLPVSKSFLYFPITIDESSKIVMPYPYRL